MDAGKASRVKASGERERKESGSVILQLKELLKPLSVRKVRTEPETERILSPGSEWHSF